MLNNEWINGKHVLITNIWLENYAGSEINCLSLAKEMIKRGADVEIATLCFGEPICAEYEKANINVKVITEQKLSRSHYDLIWAHHSIVLNRLLFVEGIKADRIVFSSLGPREILEAPPVYVNELTCCLCNSCETRDKIIANNEADSCVLFPNYIDDSWKKEEPLKLEGELQKILIVSNHVADELIEAKRELEEDGFFVEIVGSNHIVKLVTPELLRCYDLVITIGKTVQYSLSQGIPVYSYDVYGGPGYINRENFEKSSYYNFSGRGFSKKTAKEIVHEIMVGYETALKECPALHTIVMELFDLEKNMDSVLQLISKAASVNNELIEMKYGEIIRRQSAAEIRWFNADRLHETAYKNTMDAFRSLERYNAELSKQLCTSKEKISELKERIRRMKESKSWRYTAWLRR